MKYRKKPAVVDAELCTEIQVIHTLEGDMTAQVGDYIITGVKGERYPCKPDIFRATYEEAAEAGPTPHNSDRFPRPPCAYRTVRGCWSRLFSL
jgi:hypothetical protein